MAATFSGWLPFEPYVRGEQTTTAAASVNATHDNNNDGRILLLHSAAAGFFPDAAQTTGTARLALITPATDASQMTYYFKGNDVAGGAGVAKWIDWQGWLVVPPRFRIFAQGIYSGALANQTQLYVFGYLMPKSAKLDALPIFSLIQR